MGFNLNGFNVGTDFSATMSDNFGDIFPLDALGLLMEFDSQSLDKEIDVVPISQGGVPVFMTLWSGVRGTMGFTRTNNNLQSLIMGLMNSYYTAGITPIFNIGASVLNRDGSIDEFMYTGVQLSKPKFGHYAAEKEVDMGLEFRASLLTATGPSAGFLAGLLSGLGLAA